MAHISMSPPSILTEFQNSRRHRAIEQFSIIKFTFLLVETFMVNSIDTKSVIKIQARVSQTHATSSLLLQTEETTTQYRRQATTHFSYDVLISRRELIECFFPPYTQ